jgi:hypothetical protein
VIVVLNRQFSFKFGFYIREKNMKNLLLSALIICAAVSTACSQDIKAKDVPEVVKTSLMKQYPDAHTVSWEKEKGNYEANWGGKSGEDNSVQFTPKGDFIEIVKAMNVSELPQSVSDYVKEHYKNAKIAEAGRKTDAKGINFYEVEVKGKELLFDEKGNFIQ